MPFLSRFLFLAPPHAGVVQLAVGERGAAAASFVEALAINPHFDPAQAEEAREALRDLHASVATSR